MSGRTLRLGPRLRLPLDAVTRALCFTGQRGTGKTSSAAVVVEEASAAGAPSVIIDPTDVWWGLATSADGRAPGLGHVIFGGPHGHLPLREDAGAVMARLVVEQRLAAVFSIKHLRKGAQLRFVAEFMEELYHLNSEALLVVIDEAHRFAPRVQMEKGGFAQRCLGAVTDIATLGRANGLGIALVTQRLARLHADVREACELMVIKRLVGPNDRKAILEWLADAGAEGEATRLLEMLPTLPLDKALVYGPGLGILGEFVIRMKQTFDSSGTPKVGARKVEPVAAADIDLSAIEAQISATIEKAKADDPAHLRKRIIALERELRERPPTEAVVKEVITRIPEVPQDLLDKLAEASDAARSLAARIDDTRTCALNAHSAGAQNRHLPAHADAPAQGHPKPIPTGAPESNGSMTPSRQRILDALAALETVRIAPASKSQLALFAKVSPKSSGYANNLGALRTSGLIDYPSGGMVALTAAGRATADGRDVPTTQDELLAYVRQLIGPSKARIVDALVDCYPEALERELLAERVAVSSASSGYANNLGSLRSLGLLDYPASGLVVATALLFP